MTVRLLDPEDFMAHRVTLDRPDGAAARDAFARLPKRGTIEVRCKWEQRLAMQQTFAGMGAFAICLRPLAGFQEVLITALKGKVGACFETGRSATYTGAALAVMDDDHHLIVGTIRVCEKTGGLYTLPPYHGLLTVTEGEAGLLQRLETDPVPFDCNTFEPDAARLAALTFVPATPAESTTPVFYPGPFSLLVLRDGAMLRRGHCTLVATPLVKELQDRDGVMVVPSTRSQEVEQPIIYPAAFRSLGAGCLLEAAVITAASPVAVADTASGAPFSKRALDELSRCSDALRQRLLRLIRGDEPYFILTGSDPKEPLGCCPNTQVGEANRLVDVGVLSSYRENAAADSCTTTLYALAGEIVVRDTSRPVFTVNATCRREVEAIVTRKIGSLRVWRMALKGILILLAATSLFLAGRRALFAFGPEVIGFDTAMVGALQVTTTDRCLVVCLFHGRETCAACEAMGRLCRQAIETDFAPQARAGRVVFREVDYDARANRAIKKQLGLYTSTIGLVRNVHGKPQGLRLLTQGVADLWQNEAAFVSMMREKIQDMLSEDLTAR